MTGRLVMLQLLIYAILLPPLYLRLESLVRTHATATFTQRARAYAGSLTRELELGDTLESASRTIIFLDGGVEGGGCRYAALEFNGHLFGSSAADTPAWVQERGDDVDFARVDDPTYAVALPVHRESGAGVLYLGFDKAPTLAQVRTARSQILEAMIAYGIASLAAAVLLARLAASPLMQLRAASRRVALGDSAANLKTSSRVVEITDLARDLELMRSELVGTAERLRSEIHQRRMEHGERVTLENQLRHKQRLATIGTFSGGLAHEFNNILVPLILYTEESLEEIGAEHPVRENLARVLNAATRAANVVSKLLAFSRPVAVRQHERVDLAKVTHEALDLSQALVPPNIELRREIESGEVALMGDPTLLSQIVLNLLSNAVSATRESGGLLTVTIARAMQPEARVELRVKDTGHGMSAETLERIFEPFFTTRDVGEGSGLGLSIVHGIVESMGGSIAVSSTPDAGTEFTVKFPAAQPSA